MPLRQSPRWTQWTQPASTKATKGTLVCTASGSSAAPHLLSVTCPSLRKAVPSHATLLLSAQQNCYVYSAVACYVCALSLGHGARKYGPTTMVLLLHTCPLSPFLTSSSLSGAPLIGMTLERPLLTVDWWPRLRGRGSCTSCSSSISDSSKSCQSNKHARGAVEDPDQDSGCSFAAPS